MLFGCTVYEEALSSKLLYRGLNRKRNVVLFDDEDLLEDGNGHDMKESGDELPNFGSCPEQKAIDPQQLRVEDIE